jgi:disease resistance protein RPM1
MQSIEFLEGLGNLKHLTNLGIRFEYYDIGMLYDEEDNPDYWKKQQEEVIFSINKLGKASLKSLHIINNDAGMEYIEMIEESWFPRPPYGIQELVIEGYYVKMIPEWMASLVNLEKLQLPIYKMGEKGVEILGGLPSLRNLNIDWFDSDDEEQEVEVARAMQAHPNRPTLAWTYM